MSKLTEYLVVIGVIVIIALLILQRVSPPEGEIPAEVQHKLDSLSEENTLYKIKSAVLKESNKNLEQEIWYLNNQLADIKPKYIPVFKEYNNAPPEKKKELVKSEYEKRLKEREGDK